MSQKSVITVIIISVILGLAMVGYLKAVPGVENGKREDGRPQIDVTPKSFDFKEVEFGKVVNYSFKVKNLGNEILEIKKVATSCACTTAKVNQEKISPGKETELLVTYDTAAMGRSSHGTGEQERIIYVKSSDPITPQVEVMIYAYVK